ncbi:hypothetical protein IUK39_25050 [Priestia aryabhattai]|uniref:hypothetical protein n=1 Tax=Priestia aryabhattai TaxID=412384 RepID=UPI001C0D542B|nr:hypothetical protein [Priestia aryabhattai]MBU3573322.1 hypothetical protein [Priestia aryabhattai]
MSFNFVGMLSGLIIALANIFDSGFHGFMRWVMITCGFLMFISHLKLTIDKKKNGVINRDK